MEKESLEEAAERHYINCIPSDRHSFIAGANYQAERMYSEEEVRAMKPDYMLVLPWHFISEFVQREDEFLSNGGKFIVPCPKFEIIRK